MIENRPSDSYRQWVLAPEIVLTNTGYKYEWQEQDRENSRPFSWVAGDRSHPVMESPTLRLLKQYAIRYPGTTITALWRDSKTGPAMLLCCGAAQLGDRKGRKVRSIWMVEIPWEDFQEFGVSAALALLEGPVPLSVPGFPPEGELIATLESQASSPSEDGARILEDTHVDRKGEKSSVYYLYNRVVTRSILSHLSFNPEPISEPWRKAILTPLILRLREPLYYDYPGELRETGDQIRSLHSVAVQTANCLPGALAPTFFLATSKGSQPDPEVLQWFDLTLVYTLDPVAPPQLDLNCSEVYAETYVEYVSTASQDLAALNERLLPGKPQMHTEMIYSWLMEIAAATEPLDLRNALKLLAGADSLRTQPGEPGAANGTNGDPNVKAKALGRQLALARQQLQEKIKNAGTPSRVKRERDNLVLERSQDDEFLDSLKKAIEDIYPDFVGLFNDRADDTLVPKKRDNVPLARRGEVAPAMRPGMRAEAGRGMKDNAPRVTTSRLFLTFVSALLIFVLAFVVRILSVTEDMRRDQRESLAASGALALAQTQTAAQVAPGVTNTPLSQATATPDQAAAKQTAQAVLDQNAATASAIPMAQATQQTAQYVRDQVSTAQALPLTLDAMVGTATAQVAHENRVREASDNAHGTAVAGAQTQAVSDVLTGTAQGATQTAAALISTPTATMQEATSTPTDQTATPTPTAQEATPTPAAETVTPFPPPTFTETGPTAEPASALLPTVTATLTLTATTTPTATVTPTVTITSTATPPPTATIPPTATPVPCQVAAKNPNIPPNLRVSPGGDLKGNLNAEMTVLGVEYTPDNTVSKIWWQVNVPATNDQPSENLWVAAAVTKITGECRAIPLDLKDEPSGTINIFVASNVSLTLSIPAGKLTVTCLDCTEINAPELHPAVDETAATWTYTLAEAGEYEIEISADTGKELALTLVWSAP